MKCVVDASAVLALLVASDAEHAWAAAQLLNAELLAAPHLLHAEVANKLRRFVLQGLLSEEMASLAHADALALPIELLPYELVSTRVWELRQNVSAYDAWYVALAEQLDVPLVTLDARLARATGPRCKFICPP